MKRFNFVLAATAAASLFAAYLAHRLATLYLLSSGNFFAKLQTAAAGFLPALQQQPLAFNLTAAALLPAGLVLIGVWLWYLYNFAFPKNYRPGSEHGSARWGQPKDIAPLINTTNPDQNIILSATEKISLTSKGDFKNERNHNVLVIGGSGSGKTDSHLKPNLMQLAGSYVVTDPKGTLLPDVGHLFSENGYQVKTFDTVNFARSHQYNPLAYLKSDKDILKLANVLVLNTKGEGRIGDDFWVKAEKLWLSAALGYLYYEVPPQDRTLAALLDLLDVASASEHSEDYRCPLDLMFENLQRKKPDSFPVRQYRKFKLAAGVTAKSILISVASRLSPFDIAELRTLLSRDELRLDFLGREKTALFIVLSDTDPTYSFLAALLLAQILDLLTDQADLNLTGKLDLPVHLMLDEFANLGILPNFEKTISTIRSRDISATMIIQSLGQLQAIYNRRSEIIMDCCDSVVFLGGRSVKTTKEIAEMAGQTTVDHQAISQSKGASGNFSTNDQILGRALINSAEIAQMKRDECLVLISGLPPFKSRKYNPAKHPRFHYLADSGKRPRYHWSSDATGEVAVASPVKDVPNIFQLGEIPPATVFAD
jgi:type IV secretion system protein VirD4